MKRRFLILLVALALVLAACGNGQIISEAAPTPFPTPVRPMFTVQRGDITVEAKLGDRADISLSSNEERLITEIAEQSKAVWLFCSPAVRA